MESEETVLANDAAISLRALRDKLEASDPLLPVFDDAIDGLEARYEVAPAGA